MERRSLQMNLPRGWYAVAGSDPHSHTYRRHGLTTASGTLRITFESPPMQLPNSCEEAIEMLKETLIRLHVSPGTPISSGCDQGAAGYLAFAVYKHLKRGQCEYWLIPHDEATVFASWEMGAMATAGMERHDIHEMLQKLHFESEDDGVSDGGPYEIDVPEEDEQPIAEAGEEVYTAADGETEPTAEAESESYISEEIVYTEEGVEFADAEEEAVTAETEQPVSHSKEAPAV